MPRRFLTSHGLALGLLLGLTSALPAPVSGQSSGGSTAWAIGAGALGAYSGGVLGLVGATGVCDRVLAGPACPRVAAAFGGAVGLGAGLVLGGDDSATARDRFRSAAYGTLAGGVVGLGLSMVVRHYGWRDLVAIAGVGGAVGASPVGAGVGFVAGAAVGAITWIAVPRFTVGDAITASVVGLAVGGIVGWVTEAANSRPGPAAPAVVSFSVPFQIRIP